MQPKKKVASITCAILLATAIILVPSAARAQSQGDDAVYYFGSLVFNLVRFPLKLALCLGTQVVTTTAYIGTYNVEGNYEGGTNGKQIGEVARGACVGNWVIPVEQVKKDYE